MRWGIHLPFCTGEPGRRGPRQLTTDSNNFCPQLIWHGLRMSMRGTRFQRNGFHATSIKSVENLMDALPGNTALLSYL